MKIDIVITNADGQTATISQAFEFTEPLPVPVIEAIAPTSGPIAGGTEVTITGQHFQAGGSVKFGERQAQIVSVTPTQIVVITPDMR